ncbi:MAG TPA: LL-diaminopimelate aminotransferase [Verrucomicrobiae bacterium]|nr:LL-diaminopimelate aminotransferase [Verrucomicrobiae bacterium]
MIKKTFSLPPTERLEKLPPYLFAEIDRRKREQIAKGKDIVDLGVGDPDLPTPDFIIEALIAGARDPKNHRYALDAGMPSFRESIAKFCQGRFGIKLDPATEILPLIGSKEGIGHLPLALVNPGDVVLIPDPGYPVYNSSTLFVGGVPHVMPLLESNEYLPDLKAIDPLVLKKAKLMFINYPNNPTSAVASKAFFKEVVEFAYEHEIIIAQDAAYTEVGFDGYKAPSILEVEGAKDVAIELHSLSKTFNMTGWRVGFAIGNAEVLRRLGKVKSNLDSGIFQAVQLAGKMALDQGASFIENNLKIYQKRRDLLAKGLERMGWKFRAPTATFYCWIPVPPGYTSTELAVKFLDEMGIVVTPGNGFGRYGEGYFRISLTNPEERIQEALNRIEKSHKHQHK